MTGRDLSNPLAGIVAKARRLPAETGATAGAQTRIDRGTVTVVLADVSASMAEPVTATRRKVDVLNDALRDAGGFAAGAAPLIPFCSQPLLYVPGARLPEPHGSTALHLALDHALAEHDPTHLLVISDGHPNDPSAALTAADRSNWRIDVIYCGPEQDHEGIAFMRRLARGGGAAQHTPISRQPDRLAQAVRLRLPAPR